MKELRSAVAFLTVLPAAHRDGSPGRALGRAFFPAAGLLLGLLAWIAFLPVSAIAGPQLGGVAAVAVLAVLSGGLHLDGLADSADGLLAGGGRERRLEIMRDPRAGTYGVVAVVLVLLGDVAALSRLDARTALFALLAAGTLGRLAMLAVVLALPYARQSGLGNAVAGGRVLRDAAVAAAVSTLPMLLDWRHGLLAASLAAGAALGIAVLARGRIGGATGDVYGAVVEAGQLGALVAFAARL